VVLAENHVLLREGISRLVAANDNLELAGTAGDMPTLLSQAERERPDVGTTSLARVQAPVPGVVLARGPIPATILARWRAREPR
jgi:DNA-binding NarL/FixJ family response regulator